MCKYIHILLIEKHIYTFTNIDSYICKYMKIYICIHIYFIFTYKMYIYTFSCGQEVYPFPRTVGHLAVKLTMNNHDLQYNKQGYRR